jgi:glucose dehydrogenase
VAGHRRGDIRVNSDAALGAAGQAMSAVTLARWMLLLCLAGARSLAHAQNAGAVDDARLARVDEEPGQWLTSGRDRQGSYYSPLKRIDASNVARLGLAWEFTTGTFRGLEATPLVVDGVMYTSGNWGVVYALDAVTGRRRWVFDPVNDGQAARYACCDVVNRGVDLRRWLLWRWADISRQRLRSEGLDKMVRHPSRVFRQQRAVPAGSSGTYCKLGP